MNGTELFMVVCFIYVDACRLPAALIPGKMPSIAHHAIDVRVMCHVSFLFTFHIMGFGGMDTF